VDELHWREISGLPAITMNEAEVRKSIRILIASLNEKYPKMPLIKWVDFEDGIVYLVKTARGGAETKK
jgi:hypothetical protein